MFSELVSYRSFIFGSIKNEFINRFSRSKFGLAWILINPLLQVLIFTFVLSNVLSARLPFSGSKFSYAFYILSGLLCWTLFNDLVLRCCSMFLDHAQLIKKVRFPKITLPAIVVGSCFLSNSLLIVTTLSTFMFMSQSFSSAALFLVPLTILTVLFGGGIGIMLGVFNVFFRDLQQIIPIFLQLLFWLTPIVYPISIIPAEFNQSLFLNPLYHFIEAYHSIILFGDVPKITTWLILVCLSLVSPTLAIIVFNRAKEEIEDFL